MTKNRAHKLAIKALEKERRKFVVGHKAYLNGYRAQFAVSCHKNYDECSQAIEIMNNEVGAAGASPLRQKKD